MSNIYFSGDGHIGHQSILKYMPERPYATELAKRARGFIDINTLYEAIMEKTNGLTPQKYAKEKY